MSASEIERMSEINVKWVSEINVKTWPIFFEVMSVKYTNVLLKLHLVKWNVQIKKCFKRLEVRLNRVEPHLNLHFITFRHHQWNNACTSVSFKCLQSTVIFFFLDFFFLPHEGFVQLVNTFGISRCTRGEYEEYYRRNAKDRNEVLLAIIT